MPINTCRSSGFACLARQCLWALFPFPNLGYLPLSNVGTKFLPIQMIPEAIKSRTTISSSILLHVAHAGAAYLQKAVLRASPGPQDRGAAEFLPGAPHQAYASAQPVPCSQERSAVGQLNLSRGLSSQCAVPPHHPLWGVVWQPARSQQRPGWGVGRWAPGQWPHRHADAPGGCLVQHGHPRESPRNLQQIVKQPGPVIMNLGQLRLLVQHELSRVA